MWKSVDWEIERARRYFSSGFPAAVSANGSRARAENGALLFVPNTFVGAQSSVGTGVLLVLSFFARYYECEVDLVFRIWSSELYIFFSAMPYNLSSMVI